MLGKAFHSRCQLKCQFDSTVLIGVAAPQGPQDRAPVNVQTLLDKLMVSI